jgi:hypothetical protein
MKKTLWITLLITAVLTLGIATAQDKPMTADQQKAVEAYLKMGAVGPNHEFLKTYAGEWAMTTKAWMTPGQPPSLSRSTITAELIHGGRFLLMRYKGTMFGQPFEGLQIIGYDNLHQKYVTFWIDNTSTLYYLTSGTRDASGKVLNETGLWPDPVTGKDVKIRARTIFIGPDEFSYEQFMPLPDGKEFKSMDNHCTRKK